MYDPILSLLETPCILIDMEKVRANLKHMQRICDKAGVALRPHVKAHKITELARMQLAAGAKGITCAKISEAEVMADAGCGDIFIAYPLVGGLRILRALALHSRIPRLILAVDSTEGAVALSMAAVRADTELEVRLEMDTGAGRTGVRRERLLDTAKTVHKLPGLNLTGIFTYKSASISGIRTFDLEGAAKEEGVILSEIAAGMADAGLPVKEVSGGSTPTGPYVARTKQVTEIRPGTYLFSDWRTRSMGVKDLQLAAMMAATVVSTPAPDLAILDGGSKTFATNFSLGDRPGECEGYAIPMGREDLLLDRLSEEHGMLRHKDGGDTRLRVGDKLLLYPANIGASIHMHDTVYLLDAGTLRRVPVDARGKTY